MRLVAAALVAALAIAPGWWPAFRGPDASGIGDGYGIPRTWNAETNSNVQWTTPIPGLGHSSAIVWGDRVYVTTAVSIGAPATYAGGIADTTASAGDVGEQEWQLVAIDRLSGKIAWSRTAVRRKPATDRHAKATHANATPATDGEFIAASFGSEGVFVYRADGSLAWSADLGTLDGGWTQAPGLSWGFGSSPAIHGGRVVVQCDTQSQSFVVAFDLASGRELWRVQRHEDSVWASPVIVVEHGEPLVLVSGTKAHRAYALADGRELWSVADGADVKVPTPIASAGLYLFGGGSAAMTHTFFAVRAGARGALAVGGPELAWTNDAAPHVPTPLAYRDKLYVLGDAGVLTTYGLETGKREARCRLPAGAYFASPVAADGFIYAANEDGTVIVLTAGGGCDAAQTNPVGEAIVATPALAPGQFIVRARSHVFAFGNR